MKLPEYNKPGPIFFDLFFEDFELRFAKTKPITIALEKSFSIPFSEKVSERIPEHRPDDRNTDDPDELGRADLREKSPDENHDVLSRDEYTDDWKGFDDTAREGDQIVPITEEIDLYFCPFDKQREPFGFKEHNRGQPEYQEGEKHI